MPLIGFLISLYIAYAAFQRGSLTAGGALWAVIVGTLVFGMGGGVPGLTLVAFFLTSTALSKHRKAEKLRLTGGLIEKGDQRDALQVLANGGPAAIFSVLYAVTGTEFFYVGALGSLAAATSDTWATEIGLLAKGPPRHILSWEEVPAGTSGAVSAAGLWGTLLGALFVGGLAMLEPSPGFAGRALVVTIGGLVGGLGDSLLGATLQERRQCLSCGDGTEQRSGSVDRHHEAVLIDHGAIGQPHRDQHRQRRDDQTDLQCSLSNHTEHPRTGQNFARPVERTEVLAANTTTAGRQSEQNDDRCSGEQRGRGKHICGGAQQRDQADCAGRDHRGHLGGKGPQRIGRSAQFTVNDLTDVCAVGGPEHADADARRRSAHDEQRRRRAAGDIQSKSGNRKQAQSVSAQEHGAAGERVDEPGRKQQRRDGGDAEGSGVGAQVSGPGPAAGQQDRNTDGEQAVAEHVEGLHDRQPQEAAVTQCRSKLE